MIKNFDNYASTLASGYTAGGTTLSVNGVGSGATALPSSGDYYLVVDPDTGSEEVFKVTSAASGSGPYSITVAGAQAGTTNVNHSSSAVVKGPILTRAAIDQMRIDDSNTGTDASKPAAATSGKLYLPTDSSVIYRDNTSLQVPYGPLYRFHDPNDQSWSWVGQGSCTVDSTHGGIILANPTSESSIHTHARVKSVPATPYHVIIAYTCHQNSGTNQMTGICFRESSSSKMTIFGLLQNSASQMVGFHLTDENTYGGSTIINDNTQLIVSPVRWLRLGDDGTTNKTFDASHNGVNWVNYLTVGRTNLLTPNQVGFFVNSGPSSIHLLSWEETA